MSSETQSNQPVQWTIAHEAFEDIRYEKSAEGIAKITICCTTEVCRQYAAAQAQESGQHHGAVGAT